MARQITLHSAPYLTPSRGAHRPAKPNYSHQHHWDNFRCSSKPTSETTFAAAPTVSATFPNIPTCWKRKMHMSLLCPKMVMRKEAVPLEAEVSTNAAKAHSRTSIGS